MDDRRLYEIEAAMSGGSTTFSGAWVEKTVTELVAEVRRLKAVALTFEDEADRVGLELKQAREEVARLRALASRSIPLLEHAETRIERMLVEGKADEADRVEARWIPNEVLGFLDQMVDPSREPREERVGPASSALLRNIRRAERERCAKTAEIPVPLESWSSEKDLHRIISDRIRALPDEP